MPGLKVPGAISTVTLVQESDAPRWRDFVDRAEESGHAHLWEWREVLREGMGLECHYLAARAADGEWTGVLPLARIRSHFTGNFLVSLPFLNAGPVGTPEAKALLTQEAVRIAQRTGADLLEIRTLRELPVTLAPARVKCTVRLALPATAEQLWAKSFRAKLRSQIRRPQKEGMETRFGLDERDAFYWVFARNMRDLGTPVLPRRFFECVERAFAEQVIFGVVYHRGEPVAAGCGFIWRDEFELNWASSLREHNSLAPNMLLYWSFMERVIGRGVRVFDFGRCTPGSSTHRFKMQWGGKEIPLPWVQWPVGESSGESITDRKVFRLATAAWRYLPIFVANRAGPLLARRLPWF